MTLGTVEELLAVHRRFDLALPRAQGRSLGFWLSLLLHALLIGLAIWRADQIWPRTPIAGNPFLPRGGGGGGSGGGPRVAYIPLPPAPSAAEPAAAPVVPPPVKPPVTPRPAPTPVVPQPEPRTAVAAAPTDTSAAPGTSATPGPGQGPGTGGGTGGGAGQGVGPGTGPGTGPGAGGGEGGAIMPPRFRTLPVQLESPPKELRGREIGVTWWVRADGSIERVATQPEIQDEKYRARFLDAAREARFYPARLPDGRPVPASFTAKYTLPTK